MTDSFDSWIPNPDLWDTMEGTYVHWSHCSTVGNSAGALNFNGKNTRMAVTKPMFVDANTKVVYHWRFGGSGTREDLCADAQTGQDFEVQVRGVGCRTVSQSHSHPEPQYSTDDGATWTRFHLHEAHMETRDAFQEGSKQVGASANLWPAARLMGG